MRLRAIAQDTLRILDAGEYDAPNGARVTLRESLAAAVSGTRLYTPDQLKALLGSRTPGADRPSEEGPTIEVTDETSQVAARRLVATEGRTSLALLNYASARNPGGGFLLGAKAQEEDLARCSGLYPCLLTQPTYYEVNRAQSSMLYTDHMIYSPSVPWFRTASRNLLDEVFLASVITAPAPNAGEARRRDKNPAPAIHDCFLRRVGYVLAIAREHGHRTLVLGAWGCGAFRNDPVVVAEVFHDWLVGGAFADAFDHVTFAVYDPAPKTPNLDAFHQRFPKGV
ncbi:MAG: TIGR02452 family protein [Planctomycetota bacterium]|jgi:uncharacterized protein (TIGR02452 family)